MNILFAFKISYQLFNIHHSSSNIIHAFLSSPLSIMKLFSTVQNFFLVVIVLYFLERTIWIWQLLLLQTPCYMTILCPKRTLLQWTVITPLSLEPSLPLGLKTSSMVEFPMHSLDSKTTNKICLSLNGFHREDVL